MGREIKRVPLDFDWHLKKVWAGYSNPFSHYRKNCPACDGSGQNPETKRIADTFYDFDSHPKSPWHDKITDDEVQALIKEGRLDHMWRKWDPAKKGKKKWVQLRDPKTVTAEEVNKGQSEGGFFYHHDGINRWILIRTRAQRLGVYGNCPRCKGKGDEYFPKCMRYLHDKHKWIEPPKGKGYQVWETVSEGSPISPVFKTEQELGDFLSSQGYSPEAIQGFLKHQWVPSGAFIDGKMLENIEVAKVLNK